MLLRTHLTFAILLALIFTQHVSNKVAFVVAVIVATFLPDLDTSKSE